MLAVDLRGHGASAHEPPYDPQHYAQDVAETIAAAGWIDPLVVGHSLGGVVTTVVPRSATPWSASPTSISRCSSAGFRTRR